MAVFRHKGILCILSFYNKSNNTGLQICKESIRSMSSSSSNRQNIHRQCASELHDGMSILPRKDANITCKSQKLMLYRGLIQPTHPGAFILMPQMVRALEKLNRLIDEELQSVGCQKVALPCVLDGKLWKKSGRWQSTGPELMKLRDRHGKDYCLAPTHEEPITNMVASKCPVSYKSLPLKYYQISRKFRDEMHPKNGLLRGREFDMKDLYTFDATVEKARDTYQSICEAYTNILNRLKLNYVKAEGDCGNIGGIMSHEFHLPADVGEDVVYICNNCGEAVNKELVDSGHINLEQRSKCKKNDCSKKFTESHCIEIGHAFLLGTKYSEVFKATYLDENHNKHVLQMGCFGIGVTRLLAGAIETLSTDEEIKWPQLIAPYQVCIIPQKEGYKSEVTYSLAEELYDDANGLSNLRSDLVLDDRIDLSIGKRIFEAKSLGYPYAIALGKKALEEEPKYEFIQLGTKASAILTKQQIMSELQKIETL